MAGWPAIATPKTSLRSGLPQATLRDLGQGYMLEKSVDLVAIPSASIARM